MKNLIFLDIDGCLVSYNRFVKKRLTIDGIEFNNCIPFDYSIAALNSIAAYLDADIVVSSSWRDSNTAEELDIYFKHFGMSANIIDCTTPILSDTYFYTRGEEIFGYLDKLPEIPDKVLIIEDLPESLEPIFIKAATEEWPGHIHYSKNVLVSNRYRCIDKFDAENVYKNVINTNYGYEYHKSLVKLSNW